MNQQHQQFLALYKATLGLPPEYGTDEWAALDENDPAQRDQKIAAIVQAAENWRRYWTYDAWYQRLQNELRHRDQDVLYRLRETSWDISTHGGWAHLATEPTMADIMARRADHTIHRRCAHGHCWNILTVPIEHANQPTHCPTHATAATQDVA